MAYLGNTPTTQSFIAGTDTFSGTGSQTAFTLTRSVNTVNDILVVVNNVEQQPSNYTVSGTTLTFSPAPSSGTNNIYVRYLSTTLTAITPDPRSVGVSALSATGTPSSSTFLRGDNAWAVVSVTPTAVSDQSNSSTGYFDLPKGTTAQRPGSPTNGMMRFNTTSAEYEVYDSGSWRALVDQATGLYTVSYLVVAGGGGGGYSVGGGGGAGGLLASSATLTTGTTYTVTVGGGGAGSTTNPSNSSAGSNSVFSSFTAIGGGRGSNFGENTAGSGGSGAGASGANGASFAGGSGTSGQGNNGGANVVSGTAGQRNSGGGGGAGAVGVAGTTTKPGNGGAGTASSITGTSVNYAGGGGGGSDTGNGNTGLGGAGGGGNGGINSSINGVAGSANTGGGGGGGNASAGNGGAGGSGVVILSVPTSNYSGTTTGSPTVTTSGSNTILKFNSSGSYTA